MLQSIVDVARGLRRVSSGPAGGLWIVARGADPTMLSGSYERTVQDAVIQNLDCGDVFYDIGANIGFFSFLAARRVGPAGMVLAFEPEPHNAAAIRSGRARNDLGNVDVNEVAVAAVNGVGGLLVAHHIGGATLETCGAPPDLKRRITVDTITLDKAIGENGWRVPKLVKIDVEGAELAVLKGMEETLAQHRPRLLVEIDDATGSGLAAKTDALADRLASLGYVGQSLPSAYPDIDWHVAHVLALPR